MKVFIRRTIENTSKSFWLVLSIVLLAGVSVLDYGTGTQLSFSLFYLIPIVIASWGLKGNYGISMSVASVIIWFYIQVVTTSNTSLFVHIWNGVIRFGFFLLPALLMKSLERERFHARSDFLTGAFNHRHFHEMLQMEIDRAARYSLTFTVAFIDTDNFKTVNDTSGHIFGDNILRIIVDTMKKSLRKTDLIARVGGDEFSILLPETNEQEARTAISHMHQKLQDEMLAQKCSITFSIGVLTLHAPKLTTDQILNNVDKIMYMVKNNGKDNIRYESFEKKPEYL